MKDESSNDIEAIECCGLVLVPQEPSVREPGLVYYLPATPSPEACASCGHTEHVEERTYLVSPTIQWTGNRWVGSASVGKAYIVSDWHWGDVELCRDDLERRVREHLEDDPTWVWSREIKKP